MEKEPLPPATVLVRVDRHVAAWVGYHPKSGKFMMSLELNKIAELERIAKEKGITLQDLLRSVVIPEYLERHRDKTP